MLHLFLILVALALPLAFAVTAASSRRRRKLHEKTSSSSPPHVFPPSEADPRGGSAGVGGTREETREEAKGFPFSLLVVAFGYALVLTSLALYAVSRWKEESHRGVEGDRLNSREAQGRCPAWNESPSATDANVLTDILLDLDVGDPLWHCEHSGNSLADIPDAAAAALFRHGLMHMYGFNRVEARRNFRAAARIDDKCVLCWWGIANTFTHSLNEPFVTREDLNTGREALDVASKLLLSEDGEKYGAVERGFVRSLRHYYGENDEKWFQLGKDHAQDNYIRELRSFCQSIDSHPTCSSLLAEALMKVTYWNYYTQPAGSNHEMNSESLKPTAREAYGILKSVLDSGVNHPLALHLWVHLFEPTNHPERAEREADLLSKWPAGVSHLVHMAGHIYHRLGRYEDSIRVGLAAIESDSFLESNCLEPYAPGHNIALMQSSALMLGKSDLALKYASDLEAQPLEYSVGFTGMVSMPRELIYCRFGMWNEILHASSTGKAASDIPFTRAIREYALGLARAATGDHEGSESTLVLLQNTTAAIQGGVFPKDAPFYGNFEEMGRLMVLVLQARLELHSSPRSAIEKLTLASEIEKGFKYLEPEFWYLPMKQCLGAALVHAGSYEMAIDVYEEDLHEHPKNGFSLLGFSQAKAALGKGEEVKGTLLGRHRIVGSCCELGLC